MLEPEPFRDDLPDMGAHHIKWSIAVDEHAAVWIGFSDILEGIAQALVEICAHFFVAVFPCKPSARPG